MAQMPLTKLIIRQGYATLPQVTKLLQMQPNIRHLELRSLISAWNLDQLTEKDLPKLETFAGSPRSVKLLVPGRPVHSVSIDALKIDTRQQDKIGEHLWVELSRSSATVSQLILSPFDFDLYQEFQRAAFYLPKVRHLRLRARRKLNRDD
ncbi:hypothetical protein FRC01_003757, partial [Tulasnella sp. 417]